MVGTGCTEKLLSSRSIEGNAGMTMSFKSGAAMGTGDRLGVHALMTSGAGWHGHIRGETQLRSSLDPSLEIPCAVVQVKNAGLKRRSKTSPYAGFWIGMNRESENCFINAF